MSVYVIAEAGVNHNGKLKLALKLCEEAKNAGADAVKFQTWKTELVITRGTKKAGYQNSCTDPNEDQFEMLKKLELSYNDFKIIKSYCDDIGIDFLSTADEIDSLDFLLELGIPIIKIGSGDITNIPYLTYIGKQRLPIILSTGMSCLGDIEKAIDILNTENKHDITLLHCTTNYPCPMNEVNLRAMQTLKHAFKYDIGYSDHTAGIDIPIAAAAMGACVIEKHFTLDTNMEGPDHRASLNPTEFERMVHGIRNIEEALGDGIKRPNKSETVISEVVLKRIVASKNIKKGEILCKDNMSVKRCSYGINASLWNIVSGHIAPKDFDTDEPILL